MRVETSIALFDPNWECAHQATQSFCSSSRSMSDHKKNTNSIDLGLQINFSSK